MASDPSAPSWEVLVTARPSRTLPRTLSTRAVLLRLAAGLAAVLVAVAALAGFGAQWLAEREAVNDAAQVTNVLADAVVRPALSDALAAGDPAAVAAFDVTVRSQILGDDVIRVKSGAPRGACSTPTSRS